MSPVVAPGLPESTSAAIAAACGAAAEVPKNGVKSSSEVETPSAAVMSGFCRTAGDGKNIRRGPSDVNRSGSCAAVNASGNGPLGFGGSPGSRSNGSGPAAGAAATLNAFTAAECPRVTPGVTNAFNDEESEKRPSSAESWKYFDAPEKRTTASLYPVPPKPVPRISYGSSSPSCTFCENETTLPAALKRYRS